MVAREALSDRVTRALRRSPIVALIGPRQCGKTTLAKTLLEGRPSTYFDLEDPTAALLMQNPMTALSGLSGLVVIDEAQRCPDLFPVLRVLVDQQDCSASYLILGSASPEHSRQASETLAGRVEIVEMGGFDCGEISRDGARSLWIRGGFPRSFLADSDEDSLAWRRNFVRTFLERDLAQLGFAISPQAMGRFWTMLSHYHAQTWNGNEIASSMGIAPNTARRYLEALEQALMIRRLLPWYVNVGKRLVKTPKIYFRDSGLFHTLQGIGAYGDLLVHPKLGASWEGYVLEQALRIFPREDAYFYAVHSGSELDLYIPTRRLGIEIKRQDAPKVTRSMRIATEDLELDRLLIIYPGERRYTLDARIDVIPESELRTVGE
ncbi:MAG: hypothetical protein CME06_11015 [Gemmatimonadetes bacterium]|nr:hypothetical protein [Gemmatimonadota bacterium]